MQPRARTFFLVLAVASSRLTAQSCSPTAGQFIYPVNFNMNAVLTSGAYTATLSPTQVSVSQGGSIIYTHNIPTGFNASYKFYGPQSRYFLVRDVRSVAPNADVRQYLVNLAVSPLTEHPLLSASSSTSSTPDPEVQYAQGNGQAVFSYIGTSAPSTISYAEIFCSENGQSICATGPFTPTGQVNAAATASTVQIRIGGTILQECPFPAPAIAVSPTTLSFGTVTAGTSAARTTAITNSGTADLTFGTTISGANFSSAPTSGVVQAGSNQIVTVTFAPPGGTTAGTKSGTLTITHNDATKPAQTVNFTANVATPAPSAACLSPAILHFGNVYSAATSPGQSFTVTNCGGSPLHVQSATLSSGSPTNWSLDATSLPVTLNPAASKSFTARFRPGPCLTSDLAYTGAFTVNTDAPTSGAVSIAVDGTGRTKAEATFSPTALNFGAVNVGASADRSVTVANCGGLTLQLASATLAPGLAPIFQVLPPPPPGIALPPGASAPVTVRFTPPSAIASDVSYCSPASDYVDIATNDPANLTHRVSLCATAHSLLAWTWTAGSSTINQAGNYGTKGVAAASNVPGARTGAVGWAGVGGDLWLFGGRFSGFLNDLWKFDGTNWTWISGSSSTNQPGSYGSKGVPSPSNVPGGRQFSVAWRDASGNLWLFGGRGPSGLLNDLWKFDGANWTWISGSASVDQPGSYGTKGQPSGSNVPGARWGAVSWIDAAGNLWLFGGRGGTGAGQGMLNDLWRFDGTNWTWVSGSAGTTQSGRYGVKGQPAATNVPGGRYGAVGWIDGAGNLFLFGGYGVVGGLGGFLNDLWKFDGTNWTWVSGSASRNQPGSYGAQGTPAASNVPGARSGSNAWRDASGNLWLFGGDGPPGGNAGSFNDLWKFDGTNWTWMGGSSTINQPGNYGTKGVAAPSNVPGARTWAVSWIDASRALWIFGGYAYAGGTVATVNDLWVRR